MEVSKLATRIDPGRIHAPHDRFSREVRDASYYDPLSQFVHSKGFKPPKKSTWTYVNWFFGVMLATMALAMIFAGQP